MKVERIGLRNLKCFGEATLGLRAGITVVHGVNGSGKSTLLEAIFFALYGAKSLGDRTLEDVITTDEDEAAVTLQFTHGGGTYRIRRELKRRSDRVQTTSCVLEGPDGEIEGVRAVRRHVTELLRMDADAFVNCAYVRQGEVNKLIHATPAERQDVIDDLLQLGALEEYRDRASEARLGVKSVLDGQREVRGSIADRLQARAERNLHDALNELEQRRDELSGKIDRYESQREAAKQTLDAASTVLERHQEIGEEIEDLERDVEELSERIAEAERERESLGERVRKLESERASFEEQRSALIEAVEAVGSNGAVTETGSGDEGTSDDEGDDVSARIAAVEAKDEQFRERLEELRLSIQERTQTIEHQSERAETLEAEAQSASEAADVLEAEIEAARKTIDDREEALAELESDLQEAQRRFEDAPVEPGGVDEHREKLAVERERLQKEITEVTGELRSVADAIEEAKALQAAGKCPECGQPVEGSPHVDALSDRRNRREDLTADLEELESERAALEERIESAASLQELESRIGRLKNNRENVTQLLAEKRDALEDKRTQREEHQSRAEALGEEAEKAHEAIASLEDEIEEIREELGSVNERRAEINEELDDLESIRTLTEDIEDSVDEIERLRERRRSLAEVADERRERLGEKRDRLEDLRSEFDRDRVESAREDRATAEEYLEAVDEQLDELREDRDDVQSRIGGVHREIEAMEELREELEAVDERCDALESLYDEAATLQSTYGDLRAQLRQRNVDALERLLNETFDLVYRNDAYAGIELDGEYRLTVYQKDGSPLDPEQLSGGERALFNLSLRCAIYRLLAEGVEGAAPMPPLILDEPTVFLDAGHVRELVNLVESMRDVGVEQILLVSHDEELVDAADALVRVEKDSTTNRSSLVTGETPVLDAT